MPPDEKGKQHLSSASSATSKAATSVASSGGGKSWFVASEAGSGTLLGSSGEFLCFQCRGDCTDGVLDVNVCLENRREEADVWCCQDESFPGSHLRGFEDGEPGLGFRLTTHPQCIDVGRSDCMFVGAHH